MPEEVPVVRFDAHPTAKLTAISRVASASILLITPTPCYFTTMVSEKLAAFLDSQDRL